MPCSHLVAVRARMILAPAVVRYSTLAPLGLASQSKS